MAHLRNRTEVCPYCRVVREVTVDLDTNIVREAAVSEMCVNLRRHRQCVEEMRDKAILAPFEDGKRRLR